MKTYNTYQEAKIANPEEYVYKLETQGEFVTSEIGAESVRFCNFESNGYLCNPVDYCMTVEQFLKAGHKFVVGDVVLDFSGVEVVSEGFSVEAYNEKDDCDNEIYVLHASALDNPKATDWNNGDKCLYMGGNFVFIGMLCVPTLKGTADCMIQHEDGAPIMANVSELSKPESPEEKERRERLEAAYDLYCHVQSTQNQAAATFELFTKAQGIMTLHRERYLTIVDKTNYRKGE